jgi:murein DD-endopeptidase MepM/ murein hydrolase activator NlpD
MGLNSLEKRTGKGMSRGLWVIPFLLLLVLGILGVRLYEGESPQITVVNELDYLGSKAEISLIVSDRRSGIRNAEVALLQGGKEVKLFEKHIERQGYLSDSGPNRLAIDLEVDTKSLGLAEGAADLVVTVRDYSPRNFLKGNLTAYSQPVIINTRPPQITIRNSTRYIKNGGAGVVVYRTNEPVTSHGVVLNDHFHPGHPLPGLDANTNTFVAYVAVPYNAEGITSSYITVTDRAGNNSQAAVGMIFRHRPPKQDRININDDFLARKLPEFKMHYELSGTDLEQFLTINNQVRQENDRLIAEICSTSLSERLWKERFSRMTRSSTHAGFPDHRSYFYQGRKIDEQHHLGIDLASVRHAEVEAANRGKVVFADYLGIYGNLVILDHGQGVFSLYSHLSQIKANPGDILERGAVLGQTGTTGMAGGDHLHFSMLVNGIFTDPLEWWDPNWLRVSIEEYL